MSPATYGDAPPVTGRRTFRHGTRQQGRLHLHCLQACLNWISCDVRHLHHSPLSPLIPNQSDEGHAPLLSLDLLPKQPWGECGSLEA
jgi:hypothetical protein